MQIAIVIDKFNPADTVSSLRVDKNFPIPAISKPTEVLLKLTHRPINPADLAALTGTYTGFQPKSMPVVPGLEAAAVVEKIGESVTNVKVGDRVVPIADEYVQLGSGTWQEYFVCKSDDLVKIPDSVSSETACQFFINPMTIYGMLKRLNIPKGEFLLQDAANSSLGRQIISICRHLGIKTLNIVRREDCIEELKKLGADYVFSTSDKTLNIPEKVKEVTNGKLAYGALTAVPGEQTEIIGNSIAKGGKLIVYGVLSGVKATINVVDLIFRNITIEGFYLTPWFPTLTKEEKEQACNEVMQWLVHVDSATYKLEQVFEAVKSAGVNGIYGKDGKVILIN